MMLDSLVLPEEDAAARLREYEAAVREDRNEEDAAIAAGYRAAARGLPVISLHAAFSAGGWHDNGLPRLAVCRADATECFVNVEGWGDHQPRRLVFADGDFRRSRPNTIVGAHTVQIRDLDAPLEVAGARQRRGGRTIVPSVPPKFRPKRPRLANFHILWEVDEWTPHPPRDPALLRHIRGDLWSVLAVWDLTELERAVLAARRGTSR